MKSLSPKITKSNSTKKQDSSIRDIKNELNRLKEENRSIRAELKEIKNKLNLS